MVNATRLLFQENKTVQVVCPTGNSANLISGNTIHRSLKVPTGPQVKKDMIPPQGISGEELQRNLEHLLCLIVDERSMVGSVDNVAALL